jgi:hypothetical protein
LVLGVSLSGIAHAEVLECRGGQKAQQVAELTFGRRIVGHIAVSETQWIQFIDNEITPRFPDGLSVVDAAGQWRDPTSKKIVRELSKIVLIVLPGDAEDLTRLNEIGNLQAPLQAQSVGMILRPARLVLIFVGWWSGSRARRSIRDAHHLARAVGDGYRAE